MQIKAKYPGAEVEGGSKEIHGKKEGREELLLKAHGSVGDLRGDSADAWTRNTLETSHPPPPPTGDHVAPKFPLRLCPCRKLPALLQKNAIPAEADRQVRQGRQVGLTPPFTTPGQGQTGGLHFGTAICLERRSGEKPLIGKPLSPEDSHPSFRPGLKFTSSMTGLHPQ